MTETLVLSNQQVLKNLTDWQVDILLSRAQFRVMLCGRQVGKSTTMRAIVLNEALARPQQEILFVAKTHGQVKEVAWRHMIAGQDPLFPQSLVQSRNNQELSVTLVNGTRIVFSGSENPDALLGRTIDLLIMDEFQSQDPEVWMLLQPMLAARNGRAVFAGTARGFDHLYDLWWKGAAQNPQKTRGWRSWHIPTPGCGTPAGTPHSIEVARASMSQSQFEQEYLASPRANKGAVYSDFDYQLNKSTRVLDSNLPLHIGVDFNVNPMTAVVAQKVKVMDNNLPQEQLHVVDEVVLENSNTQALVNVIRTKYAAFLGRIYFYPDPAGAANKTSSLTTDHEILKQVGTVLARPAHSRVRNRVNAVNALFCNAKSQRRLFVSERCTHLTRCLIGQTYNSQGEPDKKAGLDHANDALGYLVDYNYPITPGMSIAYTG